MTDVKSEIPKNKSNSPDAVSAAFLKSLEFNSDNDDFVLVRKSTLAPTGSQMTMSLDTKASNDKKEDLRLLGALNTGLRARLRSSLGTSVITTRVARTEASASTSVTGGTSTLVAWDPSALTEHKDFIVLFDQYRVMKGELHINIPNLSTGAAVALATVVHDPNVTIASLTIDAAMCGSKQPLKVGWNTVLLPTRRAQAGGTVAVDTQGWMASGQSWPGQSVIVSAGDAVSKLTYITVFTVQYRVRIV